MTIFDIDQDRDHHFTSQKRTCFDDQSFVIRKGTQQLNMFTMTPLVRASCVRRKRKNLAYVQGIGKNGFQKKLKNNNVHFEKTR